VSQSASERFADWALGLDAAAIPAEARAVAARALLDHAGLCVSARNEEYIGAVSRAWEGNGDCTAFGHSRAFDAAGAALVNGLAAHGEDFDDTFEGTPVHATAVVMPAVLAACERYGRVGVDLLAGYVAGSELMCRMALVAPTAVHRAGFHPTAVIGTMGATVGVAVALGFTRQQTVDALGVAGSFASGIIEYLAEGAWTKRLHAGWSAQAGLRAALMGREGFLGPRTVFEGEHGFFHGFAVPEIERDYSHIAEGLGTTWQMPRIAFKPYACGTMTQPFIDCAVALKGQGVNPARIEAILCKVGEGTVHRLWEPVAEKIRPTTPYSAKFSGAYCVAAGLVDGGAGLAQFTEAKVRDAAILDLAAKVAYEIDPDDEYPRNYSGHVRVTLADGSVAEVRQPHLRGGAREPLDDAEIAAKFRANCAFGGWDDARTRALADCCAGLFDAADLSALAAFRG
jgi:2-methylcitrate dehydratase PrpD